MLKRQPKTEGVLKTLRLANASEQAALHHGQNRLSGNDNIISEIESGVRGAEFFYLIYEKSSLCSSNP